MVIALLYKAYRKKQTKPHLAFDWVFAFWEKKLENVKSNTHATWKILIQVLNRNKSRVNTVFRSDNIEVSDPAEVTNRKYRYFSSIGPKLTKKYLSN